MSIVALVVILGGAAGFFFWQYTKLKNSPETVEKETTQRIVDKVGSMFILPEGEQPTVAQVQDKEKLKDQTFFAKAENGDYILIFANAKLAILYREKINKFVNVGPIASGETAGDKTKK
ncbi:MAG TPA: hypothetical protein VFT87_05235 [Candidatus Saccharimonadales bacterium]|nr:hypothetical protein [Candidatus Saccharimonadales bacterium]